MIWAYAYWFASPEIFITVLYDAFSCSNDIDPSSILHTKTLVVEWFWQVNTSCFLLLLNLREPSDMRKHLRLVIMGKSVVKLNANSQWDFFDWLVCHQWLYLCSCEWSVSPRPTNAKCLMSTVLSPTISRRADCTHITWYFYFCSPNCPGSTKKFLFHVCFWQLKCLK